MPALFSREGRLILWLPLVLTAIGLLFGTGIVTRCQQGNESQLEKARDLRDTYLLPIQNLLRTNKGLYEYLEERDLIAGWGTQETYYLKVQDTGTDANHVLKGRIDEIVTNNQTILELLKGYQPQILTAEFKDGSSEFIRHATLYNSRWPGVQIAAETGADIPIAEPPFPESFPISLEQEISELTTKLTN